MIGTRIAHYRITAFQGGGAMGQVYKAEDSVLHRTVALKILPPYQAVGQDPSERFLREARAASALDHPAICTVYEIGRTEDGLQFIAMAWCDGVSLQQILARGPLPPERAARIALQMARGLAHAHQHGVVHRDIKPANIMITAGDAVKIVDFGLARLAGQNRLTMSGAVMGTAGYMAPEQVRGQDAGPAADIWALGVVLHEMLSGKLPFAGDSNMALLKAVVDTEPEPLAESADPAATALAAVVAHCLQKNPRRRYASADQLGDALEVVLGSSGEAGRNDRQDSGPLDPTINVPAGPPRHLLGASLAAVLVLIIVLAVPSFRNGVRSLWTETPPAQPPGRPGVAVMPFLITGPDSAAVPFGQGLAWTISERLSRLEADDAGFWAVPPGLIRSPDPDAWPRPGDMFGARRILTASGTMDRQRLDLTVLLLGQGGDTLDSTRFDDALINLKTWQRGLADWVAATVDPKIDADGGTGIRAAGTTVPSAYLACLTGIGRLLTAGRGGDLQPAIADFSAAVARDSSYALAWLGLGRSLALQARSAAGKEAGAADPAEQAAACLERAEALDPGLALAPVFLGHLREQNGDLEGALAAYRDAQAVDPTNARALRGRADLLRRLGRTAEAETVYVQAVRARPAFVIAHSDAGRFYYRLARFPEAARHFAREVELAPGHPGGYNQLGAVLFESGRYAEAESLFERSLELEPGFVACNNLSTLYYYDGRYGDAIGMARRALEIEPDDYRLWMLQASCLWAEGAADSAQVAYRRARSLAERELDLDPDDGYVLVDLASACAHLQDTGRAREILTGLESRPDLAPEIMFCMADTYEAMGERDTALSWLERAVAADLSLQKVRRFPGLRNLRSDPRFAALQAAYGD